MNYNKKTRPVVFLTLLLTVALLCGFTFTTGAYQIEQSKGTAQEVANIGKESREGSLAQNFKKYAEYGVSYNTEQDAVYYNGERVRLFVDFNAKKEPGMKYAFDLCYHDSNTTGTLCLQAVEDGNGKLTGVKKLDSAIARELFEDLNEAAPQSSSDLTQPRTLDGTTTLEAEGITATDKGVTKDSVPQSVKDWISECDKKEGAYTKTGKSGDSFITYVYYNGGGRYPWSVSAESSTIRIDLYSGDKLASKDGHCLIFITHPQEYGNIAVYLDGKKLS